MKILQNQGLHCFDSQEFSELCQWSDLSFLEVLVIDERETNGD